MYIRAEPSFEQVPTAGTGSWFSRLRDAARAGQWTIAIGIALLQGVRDVNKLSDLLFFARYPGREGQVLTQVEQKAWLRIRDDVVKPILAKQRPAVPIAPGTPTVPLGTLVLNTPGRAPFSYAFTPEDALWIARFIVGEAGGRDDADNRAVIWAMFNRYALFTHKRYPTFHQFIRAYSTPLQPVLNSWGAAKRHMNKPEFVRTGGYYAAPHTDIPRGQLRRFIQLQATPWERLPASARSLALKAATGQVPNPIGNASEFDSTFVYFHDKHKRKPNEQEWRQFTEDFARRKGLIWISAAAGINQRKNAFFIQKAVAGLPANAVRILPPRHPQRGLGASPTPAPQRESPGIRNDLVRPVIARFPVANPTSANSSGFRPIAVEARGGRRIEDRRPPNAADVVIVNGLGGKRVPLHRLAAVAWAEMVKAARAAGIQSPLLLPVSGYRSPERQERLWAAAKAKYGSVEKARQWVAPPGRSAHQTGRAIDLYLGGRNASGNVAKLRTLPVYSWLVANAARFGFYPYEKEPWHWEYNPRPTSR
jgi:hypothetical protein